MAPHTSGRGGLQAGSAALTLLAGGGGRGAECTPHAAGRWSDGEGGPCHPASPCGASVWPAGAGLPVALFQTTSHP